MSNFGGAYHIGVGTYTRTYYNGGAPVDYEFEALEFNVGYILPKNTNYEGGVPAYVCNLFFGEYIPKYSWDTSYYMENYLIIDESTINGREYTIKTAKLTFAYTPSSDNLGGIVSVNVTVSTTGKRGHEVSMGIFIDLDGVESSYTLVYSGGNIPDYEFIYFIRE